MTAQEQNFCATGFVASTIGTRVYVESVRDSAAIFAKKDDPKAAELAEMLRQFASEMDKAIKTFHQNLTDFSNGRERLV